MENTISQIPSSNNPLQKYFRQPKLFVELPSKGKFYPEGSIELPASNEHAVYAMTAKDEMMMRTPDALLNGEATVSLIESCIPSIKNAWNVPTIDLDVLLVAIRIASYGETMDLNIKTPVTEEEKTFSLDLMEILSSLSTVDYKNEVKVDDITIVLKPLSYQVFTEVSKKTFEEQRIFSLMNKNNLSETDRLQAFNNSFKKLTEINVTTLKRSIDYINADGVSVTDPEHISEFIDNVDRSIFENVLKHIESEKKKFTLKPLTIQATPEEIEKGVPETYEVPVSLDQSNFFG